MTSPARELPARLPTLTALWAIGTVLAAATFPQAAVGQTLVYRPVVPMFAPAAGPYVANYSPVGNYAAVTAFSPPVVQAAPLASVALPVVETVPSSSLGNTGYTPLALSPVPALAPQVQVVAATRTTYYAPTYASAGYAPGPSYAATAVGYGSVTTPVAAPTIVTAGYAPVTAGYAPATAGYAPVTAGYAAVAVPVVPVAPAAVVVPLRRGLFGGLRPMRSGYVYPAW